jgi:hypothetical protein
MCRWSTSFLRVVVVVVCFFFSVRLLVFPKRVKTTLVGMPRPPFFVFLVFLFQYRWHHHHSRRGRRDWNEAVFHPVLHLRTRQMHVRKPPERVDGRMLLTRRGEFRRRFVNFPRNVVGGHSRDQIARYLFREEKKRQSQYTSTRRSRQKLSIRAISAERSNKNASRGVFPPLNRSPSFGRFLDKYQIFAENIYT